MTSSLYDFFSQFIKDRNILPLSSFAYARFIDCRPLCCPECGVLLPLNATPDDYLHCAFCSTYWDLLKHRPVVLKSAQLAQPMLPFLSPENTSISRTGLVIRSGSPFFRKMSVNCTAKELKARVKRAEVKAHDPLEITKNQERIRRFDDLICSVFDELVSGGMEKKKALSATNRRLKELGEISTYPVVEFVLRKNKRLSKKH